MSTPSPFARRPQLVPTLPRGDVLGTFDTYPEAQAIVDRLAKAEFPVNQVSIVGSGLKTVERITGKLTWGKAAAAGAASGAWLGLFFGLLSSIFSPNATSFLFVIAAVLIGAGFGTIFGMVSYSISRQRHDFTSTHQVLASQYEVVVDSAQAIRAQELLARPEHGGN